MTGSNESLAKIAARFHARVALPRVQRALVPGSGPDRVDVIGVRSDKRAVARAQLAIMISVALFAIFAVPVGAADPTADPTPTEHPPTCAERYPADGPAGIDLRLGCIASELVGHYTGSGTGEPVRVSTYLGPALALVGTLLLAFVLIRFARGRAGERLAAAAPSEWWLCLKCHSVNAAGRPACYSCGTPWTPDAPVVPTSERPEFVQRFGGDRKSAGDRPGRGPDDAPP